MNNLVKVKITYEIFSFLFEMPETVYDELKKHPFQSNFDRLVKNMTLLKKLEPGALDEYQYHIIIWDVFEEKKKLERIKNELDEQPDKKQKAKILISGEQVCFMATDEIIAEIQKEPVRFHEFKEQVEILYPDDDDGAVDCGEISMDDTIKKIEEGGKS